MGDSVGLLCLFDGYADHFDATPKAPLPRVLPILPEPHTGVQNTDSALGKIASYQMNQLSSETKIPTDQNGQNVDLHFRKLP